MCGTIPPIPPPLGTSSGKPGSPNVNRVDTMPTTTDPINTTTTTNVSQSVDGPFVPMSSLSTFENPLPKRQNQWSNAESRLANQDKRLKSIIISCLPNDVMKSVIKCKTTKEMWNDLILAYEGPSDTRDTKIAALRLKFNAFKSFKGEKVNGTFTRLKCLLNDLENNGITIPQAEDSDSNVKEDQRTNNEFMADLNAECHKRALLANQKRFYKRSRRFGSARKPMDKSKETCFAYGKTGHFQKDCPSNKTSTPSYPSSNNSFNKPKPYTPPFNQTSSQNTGNQQKDYKGKYKGLKAEMDEQSVSLEDEGTTKIKALKAIAEDEPSVGKADARFGQWVDITMKKVVFTKAGESLYEPIPKITFDSESECETPKPLLPLPKLIGAEPAVSPTYVIKKRTENKSSAVLGKKADSSTEQLLLILMEECSTCGSTDHLTKEHIEQTAINKTLTRLKAQSSVSPSTKKAPMILKHFKECKYYRLNDYHSDNSKYYPRCEVCGSIAHEPSDCPKKHPNNIQRSQVSKWFSKMTLQETQKDMAQLTVMESPLPGLLM
ncbi:retrovirus-related pol polyprotein from transposon TNT 1-94 [Tanacetum coccineum]